MTVLRPELVRIIQDSREQTPFCLDPHPVEIDSLASGDYVLAAAIDYAVIERKTVPDLLSCLGHGRNRFESVLLRVGAFPRAVVLVEGTYKEFLEDTRSKIKPEARAGSIAAWSGRYCGFFFAGHRLYAEDYAKRFLMCAARELWTMAAEFQLRIER